MLSDSSHLKTQDITYIAVRKTIGGATHFINTNLINKLGPKGLKGIFKVVKFIFISVI